ncbi:MAG: AlpA family phage regulatory protein [Luminiphilus sp.]
MPDRVLRRPEVLQKTRISRSSIFEQTQLGIFLKQIRLQRTSALRTLLAPKERSPPARQQAQQTPGPAPQGHAQSLCR